MNSAALKEIGNTLTCNERFSSRVFELKNDKTLIEDLDKEVEPFSGNSYPEDRFALARDSFRKESNGSTKRISEAGKAASDIQ